MPQAIDVSPQPTTGNVESLLPTRSELKRKLGVYSQVLEQNKFRDRRRVAQQLGVSELGNLRDAQILGKVNEWQNQLANIESQISNIKTTETTNISTKGVISGNVQTLSTQEKLDAWKTYLKDVFFPGEKSTFSNELVSIGKDVLSKEIFPQLDIGFASRGLQDSGALAVAQEQAKGEQASIAGKALSHLSSAQEQALANVEFGKGQEAIAQAFGQAQAEAQASVSQLRENTARRVASLTKPSGLDTAFQVAPTLLTFQQAGVLPSFQQMGGFLQQAFSSKQNSYGTGYGGYAGGSPTGLY